MRIPAELLRPMIDAYLDSNYISLENLSAQVGLHKHTIRRKIHEGYFTFTMADLIICKVADPIHAWRQPPLDVYYHEGMIPPDTAKPAKCQNPECKEWFALNSEAGARDSSWKRQRYCCYTCQHRHWHIRHRRSSVEPGERVCADPTCATKFMLERSRTSGAWLRQIYCSHRCANRMSLRALRQRRREAVAA